MSGRTPAIGQVMLYGAPSPDSWPTDPALPPAMPHPDVAPYIAAPIHTPEQIVSLLMRRLQPALDELHARLDKIERRLPLTDDERKQLDAVRAAIGGKP